MPPFSTTVWTELSLSNSLPSGIVLSGSTTAWLVYVPGMSGANAFRMMFSVAPAWICPPTHWMNDASSEQMKDGPVALM